MALCIMMNINFNFQIINADQDDAKYIINVKQFAKFVVDLAEQVASTDIEEGMRVGVDRNKYQIHIPLPPKIDPSVTMMQVLLSINWLYNSIISIKLLN